MRHVSEGVGGPEVARATVNLEDDAPSISRVAEARGHAPRARVARVMPLLAGPHRLGLQHGDERWESV